MNTTEIAYRRAQAKAVQAGKPTALALLIAILTMTAAGVTDTDNTWSTYFSLGLVGLVAGIDLVVSLIRDARHRDLSKKRERALADSGSLRRLTRQSNPAGNPRRKSWKRRPF